MKALTAMRPAARLRLFSTATHGTKGIGVCNHDPMLDTGVGTFEYIQPASEGQNKFSSTIIQKAMIGANDSATMNSQEQGVLNDNVRQLIHTHPQRATRKPQIGISSVWYDGNPCNMHLLEVSEVAKHAAEELGMVPMRFNSIGVSDGISNGTDGTGGWLKVAPWWRHSALPQPPGIGSPCSWLHHALRTSSRAAQGSSGMLWCSCEAPPKPPILRPSEANP